MKTKAMVLMFTVLFALAMMAQTATQAAPAARAAGDTANTCTCCDQDKCPMMKDGKMADGKPCYGKDGGCCKDGKCDMKAHKDGKIACCSGDKCPMMKGGKTTAGKSCCGKNGGGCKETAEVSCCAKGAACCRGGYMPCCGRDKSHCLRELRPTYQGHGGSRAPLFLLETGCEQAQTVSEVPREAFAAQAFPRDNAESRNRLRTAMQESQSY